LNKVGNFSHHKLEVYNLALENLGLIHELIQRIPRGYAKFSHQLLNAAGATVALIGEGANRYTKGQKRQRYSEARGEAGEVAAHIEVVRVMGLIRLDEAVEILERTDRVCAMLTKLIKRHS